MPSEFTRVEEFFIFGLLMTHGSSTSYLSNYRIKYWHIPNMVEFCIIFRSRVCPSIIGLRHGIRQIVINCSISNTENMLHGV